MVSVCKDICRLRLGGQRKKPHLLFMTHNRCRTCSIWYPKIGCPIRCSCCGQIISLMPRDARQKKPYRKILLEQRLAVRRRLKNEK